MKNTSNFNPISIVVAILIYRSFYADNNTGAFSRRPLCRLCVVFVAISIDALAVFPFFLFAVPFRLSLVHITNLYERYSFPPNVIGLIAPRNINDSASPNVSRSAFAARNAGIFVVNFAVCVAAIRSVCVNVGPSAVATLVPPKGFANRNDGCAA